MPRPVKGATGRRGPGRDRADGFNPRPRGGGDRQRNHGRNPHHGSSGHHIEGFADDLDRVLDAAAARLGPKPVFGAFHSISAIAALAHAQRGRWRWSGLVLFDPPLVPTPGEALHERAQSAELFLARWAMERPDRFASPDEHAGALVGVRARSLPRTARPA